MHTDNLTLLLCKVWRDEGGSLWNEAAIEQSASILSVPRVRNRLRVHFRAVDNGHRIDCSVVTWRTEAVLMVFEIPALGLVIHLPAPL